MSVCAPPAGPRSGLETNPRPRYCSHCSSPTRRPKRRGSARGHCADAMARQRAAMLSACAPLMSLAFAEQPAAPPRSAPVCAARCWLRGETLSWRERVPKTRICVPAAIGRPASSIKVSGRRRSFFVLDHRRFRACLLSSLGLVVEFNQEDEFTFPFSTAPINKTLISFLSHNYSHCQTPIEI